MAQELGCRFYRRLKVNGDWVTDWDCKLEDATSLLLENNGVALDDLKSSADAAGFDAESCTLSQSELSYRFSRPKRFVAGDIFSTATSFSSTSGSYILSFDYLGLDSGPGIDGNLGGFIGYSYGLPGYSHVWLAGTSPTSGANPILLDDGLWHHYTIPFTSTMTQSIHIMVEDFSGSGGIAGDAYFDNIILTDANGPTVIPEPATFFLLGLGLVGLLGFNYKRRKKN